MNTTLLKTFGQKARTLLIDGVIRKLHYWGFDKDGAVTESPEAIPGGYIFREGVFDDTTVPRLWHSLQEAVNKDGLHEVAERASYIWFNRLMALQILGKNNYEQPLLDPVSVEEQTPLVVKRARGGQYDFLNKGEQERLKKILTDYEKETQVFAILLIGFCHSHSLLNRVFGTIDDYTELLLPDDILSSGGFVDLLNNGGYITQDDYEQVELIGWLYQFYISEKKDQVFKKFKDGKKAEAKDIPAATQIFTPNWIVKYMVENTVGKIWLGKHPHSPIKESLRYLVEGADNDEIPEPIIEEVKDLKLLDPASGSGHILVEGFELLYKMYLEEYYPPDEAVESILENNLYGLDIDLRAAQLAQFAVLMKAAQYYPYVLKRDIIPHIYAMPAPVHFTKEDIQSFLGEEGTDFVRPLQDALRLMLNAQNLGSIMQFDITNEERIYMLQKLRQWKKRQDNDFLQQELLIKLTPYLQVIEVLTQQYEAIAANPPYMGQQNMNGILKAYVNKQYPRSKSDLFAVFMDVCHELLRNDGEYGMVNQQSWMFLGSYQGLREEILSNQFIRSMLHLGPRTFDEIGGEVVQNTTFTIRKSNCHNLFGGYYRLVEGKNSIEKKELFFNTRNEIIYLDQRSLFKIPDNPITYWISNKILDAFSKGTVFESFEPKNGMTIHTDFVLQWHEVEFRKIAFGISDVEGNKKSKKKWFPLSRGGKRKKWYGNFVYIADYENDGERLKYFVTHNPNDPDTTHWSRRLINTDCHYKPAITWSKISSSGTAFRSVPSGFIYSDAGPIVPNPDNFLLGYLNSKVADAVLNILNPTLNLYANNIGALPFRNNGGPKEIVNDLVNECVDIVKNDWNSREISFDYSTSPFIISQRENIEQSYQHWLQSVSANFFNVYTNEKELNRIFIEIYGLQDELKPDVVLEDITILQDELDYEVLEKLMPPYQDQLLPIKKDVLIQQFISYSIGCFMGRYRLDKPGLQIAHPNPAREELRAYNCTSQVIGELYHIEIDEDGIIPLMGSKGNFADDAYNRLRQFLVAVWGEEALTQNINFMQECLNQDLEDYLVKKFWGYHVRTYSKKPIYWLFSSKKGAFRALVYMHRMNRFTAEKLRDKYLLKHIQFLEQEIDRMESNMIALTKNDQKKLDQLRKDLQECNDYDLVLKDIVTKQIEFDLDDGVTTNYELFKGVVAPIK